MTPARRRNRSGLCALAIFAFGPSLSLVSETAARADMGPCLSAFNAINNAHSYRMTVSSADRSGKPSVSTFAIAKPDRISMQTADMQMVAIGKKSWMKMGSAGWKSYPGIDVAGAFQSAQDFYKNPTGDSCSDAGMGSYHGQPAHIFKATHRTDGKSYPVTIYVFADGFPHHVDSSGPRGPVSTDVTDFNTTTVNSPT